MHEITVSLAQLNEKLCAKAPESVERNKNDRSNNFLMLRNDLSTNINSYKKQIRMFGRYFTLLWKASASFNFRLSCPVSICQNITKSEARL